MAPYLHTHDLSSTSSISSIEEDNDSYSSENSFSDIQQENLLEYLCSEDYSQNLDIGRVSITRGRSRSRHREKSKCECHEDDVIQTLRNKENKKASKHKIKNSANDKTTDDSSTGIHRNKNNPRLAIQFDLNKLLEEIAKVDKKRCALCGSPKKNTENQNSKRNSANKKSLHLNSIQDGKISFFLNDKLKITIEEDSIPPKYKRKEVQKIQKKSESDPKKESSSYANASDTYPVETCPSSCPIVKLKELLTPEDKRLISCLRKKSQTTNTSQQSKKNRDKSLQIYSQRECGTYCSKKKRKMVNTFRPNDIKVTCNGEEGEKDVTQEVVKDGDNVKIIIRVKRPNTPNEKYSTPSSANSANSSQQQASEYSQDNQSQMSRTECSRRYSAKNICSTSTCPYLRNENDYSLQNQTDSSKTNKISTINIIMSPRSISKELSKSEETMDGTNGNSSSIECWSKLEEFIDKKIEEFKLNSLSHTSRKHTKLTRLKKKRSHGKKKNMANKSLSVPSSILLIGCEDKKSSRDLLVNKKYSRVCFSDKVEKFCTGSCGLVRCSPKCTSYKSNTHNIKTKASKLLDGSFKNEISEITLISPPKSTSIHADTKSEGDLAHPNSKVESRLERAKSLCEIIRKICLDNQFDDDLGSQTRVQRRSSKVENMTKKKLKEIFIQTDYALDDNLNVKISSQEWKPDVKNEKKVMNQQDMSEDRKFSCRCSNNVIKSDKRNGSFGTEEIRRDRNFSTSSMKTKGEVTKITDDVEVTSDERSSTLGSTSTKKEEDSDLLEETKSPSLRLFVDEGTSMDNEIRLKIFSIPNPNEMSRCPRNSDCNSKQDPTYTTVCKTTCPGLKKSCPAAKLCPVPRNLIAPCTEQDNCTQTQRSIIKVTASCAPAAGCSQTPSSCSPPVLGCGQPIIIQSPKEENGGKTDVRIELYIHQLPPAQNDPDASPGGKDADKTGGTSGRGRAGSSGGGGYGRRSSGGGTLGPQTTGGALGGEANYSPSGNGSIVEEDISVNKSGRLESSPVGSKRSARGPGSDIGPNQFGKINMSTDTEEDSRALVSRSKGDRMVDESTQF